MSFKTAPVHQAYIEPQGCVARFDADGQCELWSSSQGHFVVRALTAQLLGMKVGDLRVYPAEIGGAFGGKTVVYVEPVAVMLARKSGHPVKVVMSREDVFRATGPTSGSSMTVKIGVKRDGTITAADGLFKLQAGAFPGSPFMSTLHVRVCALRHRERARGRLRRGVQPPEGRGLSGAGLADRRLRGRERARRPGAEDRHGPARAAAEERRQAGHARCSRARSSRTTAMPRPSRRCSTIPATRRRSARTRAAASPPATGSTAAAKSSATVHVNDDGTVVVATGSPDIGGSRASMAIMAAETLGVDYDQVRPIVADTASVGYTHVTGGSRVTFATGMAVVDATKIVIQDMCKRAAKTWGVDPEAVVWEDGHAKPASSNVGDFKPMSIKEIAGEARRTTGGPIVAAAGVNPAAVAPGFATQFCDVEVDPETGKVTILRFVAAQDVGRAIHPSYVEGQIQGGVVQGIGWALNEEYIYDAQGRLENAGLPRLSHPGRLRPADDRAGPGRGAESRPSLRRQGRRRGQHLPADGGDRQRDRARDRPAADRTADVAAESARRDRRGRAGVTRNSRVC